MPQKYIKIYLDYFDIKTENELICEGCGSMAVDIHHIHGRGKGMDVITNLMALCRICHDRAHSSKNYVSKEEFQYIHNNFLAGNRKAFLK
jgi:5-methylcytosine-specific restriction endonuclease McrA